MSCAGCINKVLLDANYSRSHYRANNNNNNQDDIYGAVIMAKLLREFTRFI